MFYEKIKIVNYRQFSETPEVKRSPEVDFGVWWYHFDPVRRMVFRFPTFRVSFSKAKKMRAV